MRFTIPRQELEKAIQKVLAVVSPKTTLPVLGNLLLEGDAQGNTISLTATDLDMSVSTVVVCRVDAAGAVTLPAKRFAEIVRELGEGDVEVAVDGEEIRIKSGKSNFRIVGISSDEFPTLPRSDPEGAFTIEGPMLVRMVDKVSFSVSRDETRPGLNGALWEFEPETMSMVATDGHRLALMKKRGEFKKLAGKALIVPPKALGHVVRTAAAAPDAEVKVAAHENHVTFFIGATTIDSRLIEGPFPNYENVVPKDNDKELLVGRDDLIRAVRRVAVLSDTLTHQVRVGISKNKIELVVTTPDVGEAREEMLGSFTGDSMEIGYNAQYLLEILKHIDGEEVRFLLGSPVGAAVISSGEKAEGEEYSCLLMPLRLTA